MKAIYLLSALVIGLSLAAVPAEAAKKRKRVIAAAAHSESYVVRDADGEILGQDPDPFIRLMIRKEGRIRDQQGR
jgi:hypothetical protein